MVMGTARDMESFQNKQGRLVHVERVAVCLVAIYKGFSKSYIDDCHDLCSTAGC